MSCAKIRHDLPEDGQKHPQMTNEADDDQRYEEKYREVAFKTCSHLFQLKLRFLLHTPGHPGGPVFPRAWQKPQLSSVSGLTFQVIWVLDLYWSKVEGLGLG